MLQLAYRLQAPDDPTGDDGDASARFDRDGLGHDDLPYKVEVWDAACRFVEHVVAVSASAAIGYAAYYAAAREFPGRDVTLRHRERILSRWTGRSH